MADEILSLTEHVAAEVASFTRLVPIPIEPFGYGRELAMRIVGGSYLDLTERMSEVDPFTVEGLGWALLRRVTTERGSLPDNDDYGVDLTSFLNKGHTNKDLLSYASIVKGELQQDDRVASASVEVSYVAETRSLSWSLTVEPEDPELSTFTLVVAVGEDGSLFLEQLS